MFSAEKPCNVEPAPAESDEEKSEWMQRYEELRQRINSRVKAPVSTQATEKPLVQPASAEKSDRPETVMPPNVAAVR